MNALDEAERAWRAGNPVACFRLVATVLARHSPRADRRAAYAIAREAIDAIRRAANPPVAASRMAEILERLHEPAPALRQEREALVSRLTSIQLPPRPQPVPGEALALLASDPSDDGGPFGTVVPLRVTVTFGRAAVVLAGDPAMVSGVIDGFRTGALASIRTLATIADLPRWARDARIEGVLPKEGLAAQGGSLALAAGVATASDVLGIPVGSGLALTGTMTADRVLEPVNGMAAKLDAARDMGIETVITGPGGGPHDSPTPRVIECDTLRDAIDCALGSQWDASQAFRGLRAAFLDRLVSPSVPFVEMGSRPMLLTAVGRADPYGQLRDRTGSTVGVEDGPILTLCRELHPRAVRLCFTVGPNHHNNFSGNARRLALQLGRELPDTRIELVPLPPDLDPASLPDLIPIFAALVSSAGEGPLVANVSSGTPDMAFAWMLLAAQGHPLDLMRVVESRFAAPSASRVLRVQLPGNGPS